jgi:membrane associated rhomboid family serine protease
VKEEKRKLFKSFYAPIIMLAIMYLLMWAQWQFDIVLYFLGVHPLYFDGILGIITSVFIHSDWGHLFGNSIPFFIFSTALFYYYPLVAKRVFVGMWLVSGLYLWLFARGEAWHIGASGLVYALASYHLLSAILQREMRLIAFSMLIIFLYGSMIWGFFPEFFPEQNISWQAHITGTIVGLIFSVFFHSYAPKSKKYFEDEDDNEPFFDEYGNPPYWMNN